MKKAAIGRVEVWAFPTKVLGWPFLKLSLEKRYFYVSWFFGSAIFFDSKFKEVE